RKYAATRQKEYKPEDQPWILTPDVTSTKKFRGVKEGGIGDNSDFWIFVRAPDGAFDAYPVAEWYNFRNMPTYKPLTAEEAEAAFAKSAKSYDISRSKNAEKRNAEDEEEVRSTKFDCLDQSLSNDDDEEDGATKSKKKSKFELVEEREEEIEDDRNVEFIDSDPESDDESMKSVEEMSDSESDEEEKLSSDSDSDDFDNVEPSTGLKRKREFVENTSDEHFSPPPKKFKTVAPLVDRRSAVDCPLPLAGLERAALEHYAQSRAQIYLIAGHAHPAQRERRLGRRLQLLYSS
uniref:Transcription initiation factor IIF subunit alpha n=1 Tax=Strigamia maritima TaxID=126957 RepID=T1IGZ0_STRMM